MTEAEWLACTDTALMVKHLGDQASERRLRLFVVACCYRVWHLLTDERSRFAVELVERYADGAASAKAVDSAGEAAMGVVHDYEASDAYGDSKDARRGSIGYLGCVYRAPAYAASTARERPCLDHARFYASASVPDIAGALFRDLFANPFRPTPTIASFSLRWNDATVPRLAQSIYDARDFSLMPILADALEDAGCDNADILNHCRQPGEHVRGCWVIDLLLGKP